MTSEDTGHDRPELSIVIPCLNEAARIGPTIEAIRDWARAARRRVEVVVVADGCCDATADIARSLPPEPLHVRVLEGGENRGKGASVARGMLAARGAVALFTDADLPCLAGEFDKLLRAIDQGADVAIASRAMPDSVLRPPQPPLRRLAGRVFRAVRRRLILPDLRDTQCGLKAFRQPAARALFERLSEPGAAFDCELLLLARQEGLTVREIGVVWGHRPGSRVRLTRDAPGMLRTVLRLRRRHRQT